MFDGVAKRYDITNTVLSFAQDRRWRAATRRALGLRRGEVVLDLAAGTAVSTVELAKSGAQAVAADFSLGMLKAGANRAVPKVAADALALPFADESFDAATISFGLRNVNDVGRALRELRRVLRPGGRLVIYGPFLRGGRPTSEGDAAFDADLRAQDARLGYKDLGWVMGLMGRAGLGVEVVPMPANNLMLVTFKT